VPAQPTPEKRRLIPVEGHPGIYKRGDRYVVKWKHRGKPRKSYHRTLTEARREKGRRASGATEPISRQRFDAYAREWLRTYQGRSGRGVSDKTREGYREALDRYAIPFFGTARLGEIDPPDVREFIAELTGSGLTANSARAYFGPVRALFAQAFDDGHIARNPAAGARVFVRGERKRRPRTLTPDEIGRLLAEIPTEHRELVAFMAYTGVRISEALAATWADVGQEDGAPALRIPDSKTDAGVRSVPLSPGLNRTLLRRRANARWATDADPIFPSSIGTPIGAHNWRRRVWRPAVDRAGVSATPHTLRHSLASLLFERGHTAAQVAAWLGHQDPSFTLRTYVHARDVGDAAFLDDVLGGGV
jgi:integrase